MNTHFSAPWSQKVRLITLGLVVALAFVSIKAGLLGVLLCVAILLGTAVFSVQGYSVAGGDLLVHRLGWAKRFSLAQASRVAFEPNATVGSVRTFGVGGLFGFYGRFRNAVLGSYTAYATDPSRTVVLELGGKTIVVTPDDPARFVAAVEQGRGAA